MKTVRLALLLTVVSALFLSGFACKSGASSGAATAVESKKIFKTYPYGDPDPVPIFARSTMWGNGARLYPYTFFNKFSATGADQEWTVVRLENPYISVSVLPQVGGKVWGATDKTTGRDFLYANHVMKFREIALRGPWTSGGIEFNFGIVGHSPATAAPVDYVVRNDPDGGASVVVGAMDLPSRTRWSVTVRLAKDKGYFETNGAWHNPTPFSQSYYYWSCAAIKTAEDLKYIFPGRFQIGHNYDVPFDPWPVTPAGVDLSWYKNNATPGSKSYFTVGEREDFYGAWYEKTDDGFGHWASYDDLPGRKVWIWDLSRSGEIWVDLLTDTDGQYTEPQAGRLLNQSDHEFLRPGAADRWEERWFPYRGVGPMMKTGPTAVLGATATTDGINLGLYPLRAIDEDLVVTAGGEEIYRKRLNLKTAEPFKTGVTVSLKGRPFTVRLGESLVYESDPAANDIDRPLEFKPVDESTAEGLFLSGVRNEKGRYFDVALEKYRACLAKEPGHMKALTRMAELYVRRGEAEKGLSFARRALAADMYDPAANYIYGVVARRMGKIVDAKETFGWAARSLEFRSGAYVQLAEIALLEKSFERAAEYARRALEYNAFNSSAYEVLATALRKRGLAGEAEAAIQKLIDIDPLDHQARFERFLLSGKAGDLKNFQGLIRNEMPHETYLEAAMYYVRNGLPEDAVVLLKLAPEYPTVHYWQAFLLKDSAPQESAAALEKASSLSPLLVFPYRAEEIPLFEWAAAARPDDWKPKYYLGLILWGKGRIDEAKALFAQGDKSDFAPFFLSRAMLYRIADPAKAQADYERAVSIDPKSWRNFHTLFDFQTSRKNLDQALATVRQAAGLFPAEVPVQVDFVKGLMAKGLFAEASSVLDGIKALPFEGASEIHNLFAQTHIRLGVAKFKANDWPGAIAELDRSKEYPESLGSGKPFDADTRVQDYLIGLAAEKLGQKEKAAAAFQAVVDFTAKFPKNGGPGAYAGVLALRRAGQAAKANEIMKIAALPSAEILSLLK
jgi:tetratricopeptide (TPR) repeat protein